MGMGTVANNDSASRVQWVGGCGILVQLRVAAGQDTRAVTKVKPANGSAALLLGAALLSGCGAPPGVGAAAAGSGGGASCFL